MVACRVPAPMQTADMAATASKLLETAEALWDCLRRHAELIEWVNSGGRKEASSKEDSGP